MEIIHTQNPVSNEKILMSASDMQKAGIPRAIVYQLLNRADLPVVQLGRRKFMNRSLFLTWLEKQSGKLAG